MGLCLLRIISFVSEWRTIAPGCYCWITLLCSRKRKWPFFLGKFFSILDISEKAIWAGQDLSATEKLRHWVSQKRSAISKHNSLPRCTVPLHYLHPVPVVLSRTGPFWTAFQDPLFFSDLLSLPQHFPRLSLASCFANQWKCKFCIYMAVWQGVCIALLPFFMVATNLNTFWNRMQYYFKYLR